METITINIDEYNLLKAENTELMKEQYKLLDEKESLSTTFWTKNEELKEQNKKLKKDLDIIHQELWSCDSEYDGKIDESVDNIKAAMNAAFLNTTYIAYLERIRDEDWDGIVRLDC